MRKFLLGAAAPVALAAAFVPAGHIPSAAAQQAAAITASERRQGAEAHPSIVNQFGGAYAGPQAGYAARVGQRIGSRSGLGAAPQNYNVTLLNSPVNNALAIPGGYVYVTRQLMALMNDEAELAAVLGHEVGHVAARHSARRQSVATRNSILGAIGQVLVSTATGNSQLGSILSRGIGAGTQIATLGYSRKQETQSDDLAVRYLAGAGYDPAALATMLESLAAQEALDQRIAGTARSAPAWASSHPEPAARVQRARAQAARAGAGGERNRDAYLAAIDGMMYGEDPRQGVIEGREFLHPEAGFAFTIPAGFAMQNGAEAVSISGPNAQAVFAGGESRGDLEAYVDSVVRSLGSGQGVAQARVERTSINGLPAAYAQFRAASGQQPVDVTVFAYGLPRGRAYHFTVLTPAGSGPGALAPMLESFRTLSASQSAAIRPRFVRVVTVGPRDTIASLSARMAYPDYRVERFRVLNRLSGNTPPAAGTRVKIVTY